MFYVFYMLSLLLRLFWGGRKEMGLLFKIQANKINIITAFTPYFIIRKQRFGGRFGLFKTTQLVSDGTRIRAHLSRSQTKAIPL